MIYLQSINRSIEVKPITIEDVGEAFYSQGYFSLVYRFVSKIFDISDSEKEIISLQDVVTLFIAYRSIYFPNIEISKGYYPIDFIGKNREPKTFVINGEIYNSSIRLKELVQAEKTIFENSNKRNIDRDIKLAILKCSHQDGFVAGDKLLKTSATETTLSSYHQLIDAIQNTSPISLDIDPRSKDPILVVSRGEGGKPVVGVPFRSSNFFTY